MSFGWQYKTEIEENVQITLGGTRDNIGNSSYTPIHDTT